MEEKSLVPSGAVGFSAENQVVVYPVTEQAIAELRENYSRIPTDLTVKAEYEYVRKATSHLRGLRGDVEKKRKGLKEDAIKWGKLVDSTAKKITEQLLEIETPLADLKKNHDTAVELAKKEAALAEERRVDAIAERIALIKATVGAAVSQDLAGVKASYDAVTAEIINIDDWAMEFTNKARIVIVETQGRLKELADMKAVQEAEAARKAAEEAERKLQEEADRKRREAELFAEQVRIKEEREAMAAERKRMEADRAALAAENKRIADELAAAKKKADDELAAIEKAKEEKERADSIGVIFSSQKIEQLSGEENAPSEVLRSAVTQDEKEIAEMAVKHFTEPEIEPIDESEKNSVFFEAQKKSFRVMQTIMAITSITFDEPLSEDIFQAIIAGKIPNVIYDDGVTNG